MSQVRKPRAAKEPESEAAAAGPLAAGAPTFFMTDAQLQALGLDPATAQAQLADASLVYAQIGHATTGVTRDGLVHWAVGVWPTSKEVGPVDRLNAALALLQKMGLAYQIN